MQEAIKSKRISARGKDYFFDLLKAKNGNNYVKITESRKDQNGTRVRSTITLFKDYLKEFRETLDDMGESM